MNPNNPLEKDTFSTLAVDLINNRAADLDGPKVIGILPDSWNISIILPALKKFSRTLMHQQRNNKISRSLHKSENISLHGKLINCTKFPIEILPNHYCVECQKPFKEGNVARYPNGVMLHSDCIKNNEVCPVTGEVFVIRN